LKAGFLSAKKPENGRGCALAKLICRVVNGAEGRGAVARDRKVVKAHDSNVPGNQKAATVECKAGAKSHLIIGCKQRSESPASIEQPLSRE
jgi:hypothetical protein